MVNLWDVTDGDINRFSKFLLESSSIIGGINRVDQNAGDSQCLPLLEAFVQARDKCNFKYFTGGAPVIYGLPFKL